MSARPLDSVRSRTLRCRIARQLKKESNMPSGRLMKHLFLPLLGFGVIAAATAASAQTAPPAFVSAIGDNTNVVFVEDHSIRKHRLSGWEKAELGADDSRLYSWLRVGGHGAAHRQRRQALAASAFTCGLDRTVSSRWQEYVQ